MPVSINNTTLTFNDATTQTTSGVTSVSAGTGISVAGGKTPTITNTGVTSISGAGTVSVSASTGAVTITGTGGTGTVTSVATGNGLQGGTITTSGTLSIACPSYNTVGSYTSARVNMNVGTQIFENSNYAAGTGSNQMQSWVIYTFGDSSPSYSGNTLSGTWKNMSARISSNDGSGVVVLACRVS